MAVQATYFREQADNSRDLASRLDDREMQQHLLEIAEQYDRLAREAAAPLMEGRVRPTRSMDAPRGFEPRLTESESVVLPLDDGAIAAAGRRAR